MTTYDPKRFCTHCRTIQPRETFRRVNVASKYTKAGYRDVCEGCYKRRQERDKARAA